MTEEKTKSAPECTDADEQFEHYINSLIAQAQKGDIESLKTIKEIVDD